MPTPILNEKTPHEMLLQSKPKYGHLRVFGCLAYAHNNAPLKNKFDCHAKLCILVRYPNGQRGYHLYDLSTKKLYTSCDVIFYENIFPFQNIKVAHDKPILISHHNAHSFDDDFIHPTTSPIIIPATTHDASNNAEPSYLPSNVMDSPDHSLPEDNSALRNEPPPPLRRSQRSHVMPACLDDYVCTSSQAAKPIDALTSSIQSSLESVSSGKPYSIVPYLLTTNFSAKHNAFLSSISSHEEPSSYQQTVKYSHWRDAMDAEIKALELSNTWTLQPLPPRKHVVCSKWVYKIKCRADGSIEHYKSHLLAKGYT